MARLLALAVLVPVFASMGAASEPNIWQIETVDPSGSGLNSTLRFDKDGDAHICYVQPGGGPLKYGYWQHSLKRWFTMVVDDNPNGCALTLDSHQHPHISYEDFGTAIGSRLRYAHWDGTTWQKQVIPISSEVLASYNSIALDKNDYPTIAVYEYRGPKGSDMRIRMRTVTWNGKYWEMRTVDGQEGSGKVNSMLADSQGNFHLAYAQVVAGEMRYAFWNGKAWSLEKIESREDAGLQYVGLACAIALDKQDNPHVTYLNEATLQVKYAYKKNGQWYREVVDQITGIPGELDRNSITLDDQGRPYLAYHDARLGLLMVAHKEGSRWVAETVDSNAAGFNSSIQIDHGVLWVSYADEGNRTLKVAHRNLESGGMNGGAKPAEVPTSSAHAAASGK
jgi:hypothetical protein